MSLLQIVVTGHCLGCDEARLLYQEVMKRFPHIRTEFIDLEQPNANLPAGVLAVPSYILDGKVIFVGNPFREELFQKLAALHATETA